MTPNEDFIHFIWKRQAFDQTSLKTNSGESIRIIHPGFHNQDAGPDFLNAQIVIGETHWAGNVEIHVSSSDWDIHKHQDDPAFSNTILHVVYWHDKESFTHNHRKLDVLEIRERVNSKLINTYNFLVENDGWVPCEKLLHTVTDAVRNAMLERSLFERLRRKSEQIGNYLRDKNGDIEYVQYQRLMESFGFKVNALPMLQLSERVSITLVRRYVHNRISLEALIFGSAGLLEGVQAKDEYISDLKKEFDHIKSLHGIKPMKRFEWKFMRTRPQNFPTIRLAQWCAFLFENRGIPNILTYKQRPEESHQTFAVEASDYWKTHVDFNKTWPKKRSSRLGKNSQYNLTINGVILLLFAMGEYLDDQSYKIAAHKALSSLPAESNKITRGWSGLDFPMRSAADSQASIELKNEYCKQKKCVLCQIGSHIFQNENGNRATTAGD